MVKDYKPFEHPRWHEDPGAVVIERGTMTKKQQKQEKQFQKDLSKLVTKWEKEGHFKK